jgi:hypothetical protein
MSTDVERSEIMKRTTMFAAAVVGAMAVAAGAFAFLSPFREARATSSGAPPPPAAVDALLAEMAPGAVVRKHDDGSVSVFGKNSPVVEAEMQRARQLARVYPTSVRCGGSGAVLDCAPVGDADVATALAAGEHGLYFRSVYRAVTKAVTDRANPMFEAAALVCGRPQSTGAMSCSRVDRVQPVIGSGETLFVVYKPYNVTFDAQGNPTNHISGNLVVPLERAAP